MVFAQRGRYVPWASNMEDTGMWDNLVQILNLDCSAHLEQSQEIKDRADKYSYSLFLKVADIIC